MNKKMFVKKKPIKCPNCGFKPVAKIIYGDPSYDEKMQEELESKKIVLGGCCIYEENPIWHCTNCNTNFYPEIESLEEFLLKQE